MAVSTGAATVWKLTFQKRSTSCRTACGNYRAAGRRDGGRQAARGVAHVEFHGRLHAATSIADAPGRRAYRPAAHDLDNTSSGVGLVDFHVFDLTGGLAGKPPDGFHRRIARQAQAHAALPGLAGMRSASSSCGSVPLASVSWSCRPANWVSRLLVRSSATTSPNLSMAMRSHSLGFFRVVGGQDHRVALAIEPRDELPQRLAQLHVDAGGRLVEHDHRRAVHRGATSTRRFMPPESWRILASALLVRSGWPSPHRSSRHCASGRNSRTAGAGSRAR